MGGQPTAECRNGLVKADWASNVMEISGNTLTAGYCRTHWQMRIVDQGFARTKAIVQMNDT